MISVPELILDAWPILEWLKGREPTTSLFREIVQDAIGDRNTLLMCRINYGEVIYSIRKSFPADRVDAALRALGEIPIRLSPVDDALVDEAVGLKAIYPISYADAFAAAFAMRSKLPLVSGDPELLNLAPAGLQLYWVGK